MKIKKIIQYYKLKYLRNRIIYHRYKILQKKYDDLLKEELIEKAEAYDSIIRLYCRKQGVKAINSSIRMRYHLKDSCKKTENCIEDIASGEKVVDKVILSAVRESFVTDLIDYFDNYHDKKRMISNIYYYSKENHKLKLELEREKEIYNKKIIELQSQVLEMQEKQIKMYENCNYNS